MDRATRGWPGVARWGQNCGHVVTVRPARTDCDQRLDEVTPRQDQPPCPVRRVTALGTECQERCVYGGVGLRVIDDLLTVRRTAYAPQLIMRVDLRRSRKE